MSEIIVFRLLENLIPLLLAIIIMIIIIYILIKKLFSPFSAVGNFLWDKSTKLYNKVAQERKTKLQTQLKNKELESSEWKNKYIRNTNFILEIKDKLSNLSKTFTELNEIEMRSIVTDKHLFDTSRQIDAIQANVPRSIFAKIGAAIKIKSLSRNTAKNKKMIEKNEKDIIIKKEQIKIQINELLDSMNGLSSL